MKHELRSLLLIVSVVASALPGCTTILIRNGGSSSGDSDSPRSGVGLRAGLSFGSWGGAVSESFGSQSSSLAIAPAWAGEAHVGLDFGSFFVDWAPAYYGVGKVGRSDGTNNAYFDSLVGFEAGFSLLKATHVVPLEVFVGYDPKAEIGYATGTQSVFDGSAAKVGLALPLIPTSSSTRLGIRAEARDNFLNLDNSGPVAIGVSSWSCFVGLSFMFSQ
jgi:hypothetical protein